MTTRTDRNRRRPGRDLQSSLPDRLRQRWADRRRGGRWPRNLRRVAAAALVLTAALLLLTPPRPAPGRPVVVLTRDLPVGAVLQPADLTTTPLLEPPDGALADPGPAVGRILAGAARRGEVLTDVRLVDPIGPQPGPGRVAVPIRPADATVIDLLRPGMHVAVVSVTADGAATALVPDAVVLLVGTTEGSSGVRRDRDPPVVLAVPQDSADQVVAAALTGTVALRFI
ncbi:MAG TPA: SAF domain-containing protein [Nakamurella sp.]